MKTVIDFSIFEKQRIQPVSVQNGVSRFEREARKSTIESTGRTGLSCADGAGVEMLKTRTVRRGNTSG